MEIWIGRLIFCSRIPICSKIGYLMEYLLLGVSLDVWLFIQGMIFSCIKRSGRSGVGTRSA